MADEYIRKQDAAGVIEKEMENYVSDIWYKSATHSALNDVNENIKSLEPADVAPVVRCRKCKYFWTYQCMDSMPIETCELAQTFYNPDLDFCSLAKRREE